MTGRIDITCSLPAPTLAQVRAWLTREGWAASVGPLGPVPHAERWSHTKHGSVWVPREELMDWLTYISNWIANRAWQIEAAPEAVYREIVGHEARVAELETQLRAMIEAAERAQTSCEFGCAVFENVCGQCESLLGGIAAARAVLTKDAT